MDTQKMFLAKNDKKTIIYHLPQTLGADSKKIKTINRPLFLLDFKFTTFANQNILEPNSRPLVFLSLRYHQLQQKTYNTEIFIIHKEDLESAILTFIYF